MTEPISPETVLDDDAEPVPPPPDDDDETAEHEEAEHEQAASEQDDTPEAVDPKVIDKVFRQLDGEAARHAKRLGEIMDEDAQDLLLCPTCAPIEGMPNTPGFVLNAPLHPIAVERMRDVLGLGGPTELKPDPYSRLCETCEGWGVVATGSHVQNQDAVMCRDCHGRGHVPVGEAPTLVQLPTVNGGEPAPAAGVPAALGPEPPEAEALRRAGWAVIPPMKTAGQ